ncbi:MAG: pyruvate kinase [Desulfobacterales bacterium]
MPRTKIICTIGPASESPEIIRRLIQRGMSVARLNFSHGTHREHQEKIDTIRQISQELARPVAILQDLCGPKIRVGEIREPGIRLNPGQSFTLTGTPTVGDEQKASVSYAHLSRDVKPDDRILLADGMMELIVRKTTGSDILCEVIIGGILTSHKGINVPTSTLLTDSLTDKDRVDLRFGLENDVDYVALSFVRSADDIADIKAIIKQAGKDTPVIAKIEKHEALENIEDIIAAADGIMVARGDLGVEVPLEKVPRLQKRLIERANAAGTPVIIATQMLLSMVDAPRPTRAEATDVANAVLDGADAVMLSEETANGKYPVGAVEYLVRIAEDAEKNYPHNRYLRLDPGDDVSKSVSHASCILADHLDAAAIIAPTRSGSTAMNISRFRPKAKIIALSPVPAVTRRLALYWGCIPRVISGASNIDELIDKAAALALESGEVDKGARAVITAGHPVWVSGTTNMLRVKQL